MNLTLLSPAKLNLFLTITGKRQDGYHNLQTIFQFLTFGDWMSFKIVNNKVHGKVYENTYQNSAKPDSALLNHYITPFSIQFIHPHTETVHPTNQLPIETEIEIKSNEYVNSQVKQLQQSEPSQNLIYKAAMALINYIDSAKHESSAQKSADQLPFVEICVKKQIPLEAGLGGGSSNAATTLLALNKLWSLNLSKATLAKIGLSLGADVPIFIEGISAFAEGVGEKLIPVYPNEDWYLLLYPNLGISTTSLFKSPELNRSSPIRTIEQWNNTPFYNDFEPVARKLYPEVDAAMNWLGQFGSPRMTGTGSTLFLNFANKQSALEALQQVPQDWWAVVTRGVNISPTHQQQDFLIVPNECFN